jgi:multidrug resistance efflux pump
MEMHNTQNLNNSSAVPENGKKTKENIFGKLAQNKLLIAILAILIIGGTIGGFAYWKIIQTRVYTDKAEVSAPTIELAPENSGILQETYVNIGDLVEANTAVARVGDMLIKTKVKGLVINVNKDIGQLFNRGQAVVTMIDPNELRIVGQVTEDKGLRDIKIGQRAIFTVDAFGSNAYDGVVDEISPTSRQGDIVFNISDKRQEKEYNVYIIFDITKYPELKNGMSAKLWIYK